MRTKLKLLRVENKLTQEGMANKIGCNRSYYNGVENGKHDGSRKFWQKIQELFLIPDCEMWEYMKNDED